jgi:hypothetical protein
MCDEVKQSLCLIYEKLAGRYFKENPLKSSILLMKSGDFSSSSRKIYYIIWQINNVENKFTGTTHLISSLKTFVMVCESLARGN